MADSANEVIVLGFLYMISVFTPANIFMYC